ncbi:MAG TPA: DNA adenine methylase [Candidatus Baltobacteraceae bacterium]|jgi:adenine-specific DNA methylase|nr:DNA adenine methylase [Candidatus Baltobacteraceae bacterium]
MKYMGSKRAMLQNGLGKLLDQETALARRFVDLFAGSGAVSIHVAQRLDIPVLAFDLQRYSTILTNAVLSRRKKLDWQVFWSNWKCQAQAEFHARKIPKSKKLTRAIVADFRMWCDAQSFLPFTKAYGGHYFSPEQAVWIDALRSNLPAREPERTVALAALIQAASQCVAAPGHTAQPFQPTRTAKFFLAEAWSKDVVAKTQSAFEVVAGQFAQQKGSAIVADANTAATQLQEGDLAFIDPPYSGVHYSRFYHVLETIADGHCGDVSGVGRYPARARRPRSKYSVGSESAEALDDLLKTVASRGASGVMTFPDHDCSNGLSGDSVREIAVRHFRVCGSQVESQFSTLGGTGNDRNDEGGRTARQHAHELMLVLHPRGNT